MSGGSSNRRRSGSGGNTEEPEAPELEGYINAPITRTFQPALPGGLDALSSQLSQGYGGVDTSFLSNLYRPMDVIQFMEPISTTAKQFDKEKHAPINTGNPYLDKLLMGEADDDNKKKRRKR